MTGASKLSEMMECEETREERAFTERWRMRGW